MKHNYQPLQSRTIRPGETVVTGYESDLEANGLKPPKYFRVTREFRCPKKGEWFVSGALPQAYYAVNDSSIKMYICAEEK